jgi:general secretion pathway protein K
MKRLVYPYGHLRSGKRAQGFVLATVLWLLAGLTVAAALAGQYAVDAAQSGYLLRQKANAEQEFLSSKARLLYLLATTAARVDGRAGADAMLIVDDRSYTAEGGSEVQVQDARGLVNLNRVQPENGVRLLTACGVEAKAAAGLMDKLLDYTDADDLSRLEGAELAAYRQNGLPGPRNLPLAETHELWQVLGWPAVRSVWQERGCNKAITVISSGGFNMRTAPLPALLANGLSEPFARELIAQRSRPTGADSLAESFSRNDESSNPFNRITAVFPGEIYRVTHLGAPDSNQMRYSLEYWVDLKTGKPEGPWSVSYSTRSLVKMNTPLSGATNVRVTPAPTLPRFGTASSSLPVLANPLKDSPFQ